MLLRKADNISATLGRKKKQSFELEALLASTLWAARFDFSWDGGGPSTPQSNGDGDHCSPGEGRIQLAWLEPDPQATLSFLSVFYKMINFMDIKDPTSNGKKQQSPLGCSGGAGVVGVDR